MSGTETKQKTLEKANDRLQAVICLFQSLLLCFGAGHIPKESQAA